MTMAQHAQNERTRADQVQAIKQAAGIVQPPEAAPQPTADIQPLDILPEEARRDPAFVIGQGDMFAANQPLLALKYGVVRSGKVIPPQLLMQPTGPPSANRLSDASLRDLEQLKSLEENQTGVPAPNPGTAEMGKAAGAVGNVPGDKSSEPLTEEERARFTKAVDNMDEFEFDTWRQTMMKDILNSPEQREIIEARLEPMSVEDLVVSGYAAQRVPVIPGKFEIVFKTTEGDADLAIKRLIMEDARSLEVNDRYYLDKFSLMSMTALLHGINNKTYMEHRDKDGDFNDDAFREKFRQVLRLPTHMLASIGVNAMWFEARVRKLFAMEKLGNG
jgi:hypothetical protein